MEKVNASFAYRRRMSSTKKSSRSDNDDDQPTREHEKALSLIAVNFAQIHRHHPPVNDRRRWVVGAG